MLDIAWPEILVVGVVTLVVMGPKDIPIAMETLGKIVAKARDAMADIRHIFEQMRYEAEIARKLEGDNYQPDAPPDLPDSEGLYSSDKYPSDKSATDSPLISDNDSVAAEGSSDDHSDESAQNKSDRCTKSDSAS